jgi:hypothetical protein
VSIRLILSGFKLWFDWIPIGCFCSRSGSQGALARLKLIFLIGVVVDIFIGHFLVEMPETVF